MVSDVVPDSPAETVGVGVTVRSVDALRVLVDDAKAVRLIALRLEDGCDAASRALQPRARS